jgi:hypothetical protein
VQDIQQGHGVRVSFSRFLGKWAHGGATEVTALYRVLPALTCLRAIPARRPATGCALGSMRAGKTLPPDCQMNAGLIEAGVL